MFKRNLSSGAVALLALSFAAIIAPAQPASPPAESSATVKGHAIKVNYSSPSMKGRKVMGELVPFGKVWRTGANNATTLTTDGDLTIGSLKIPKGTYSLFTVPNADSWELIVNKQTGQSGLDYDQGQDVGRVKMAVKKAPAAEEKFKITVASAGGNKGTLTMAWENSAASVTFTVD